MTGQRQIRPLVNAGQQKVITQPQNSSKLVEWTLPNNKRVAKERKCPNWICKQTLWLAKQVEKGKRSASKWAWSPQSVQDFVRWDSARDGGLWRTALLRRARGKPKYRKDNKRLVHVC